MPPPCEKGARPREPAARSDHLRPSPAGPFKEAALLEEEKSAGPRYGSSGCGPHHLLGLRQHVRRYSELAEEPFLPDI